MHQASPSGMRISVGSTAKVIRRMDQRVAELVANMPRWLRAYDAAAKFSGPSLYFHLRPLECLRRYPSPAQAIASDDLFDWLYATLAAWGMHRMGRGSTKLRDLPEIKESVRAQAAAIEALQPFRLADVSETDLPQVSQQVWRLLDSLTISLANAKIVANSKVLHHILPDLVPPIDRTYTYNFFYNRNLLSISEEVAFAEMFVRLHRLAATQKQLLRSYLGPGWYSSETKIIDNALVGFVIEVLRNDEESASSA